MSRIHSFLCVEQPLADSFKVSPRVGRACSLVNFLSIVHFAFLNSSNVSCFFVQTQHVSHEKAKKMAKVTTL